MTVHTTICLLANISFNSFPLQHFSKQILQQQYSLPKRSQTETSYTQTRLSFRHRPEQIPLQQEWILVFGEERHQMKDIAQASEFLL
ncbi:hypothetical protein CDAR_396211 [Caerostris darwini]|uniref:Uncharacterized protein n=1 Tax=Caerostris darwini TaxID=1538125 RepID=A0AAV4WRA9_9ARAC|nr:hypothetical protein CDAR_396211 [Caerostris darwini]